MRRLALFIALGAAACRAPERAAASLQDPVVACPAADARAKPRDPTALVVVHSFTGNGARVGCELAAMLGARLVRFGDAPFAGAAPSGQTLRQVLASLQLAGVERLYLGFPLWGDGEPSEPIRRFVAEVDLHGIHVLPFYSFLHYANPVAMEQLRKLVRARGGTWEPPLALRAPPWLTASAALRLVHQAVLGRRDLWASAPEPPPSPACGERCRVPAGRVWIGDNGGDGAPDGYVPPRLTSIAAFEIDRAEVTVAQYRRCVDARRCPPPQYERSFCGRLVAGNDALASPCISYEGARDYCAFVGMRLPSEAEWIRAGRGDGVTAFAWGDELAAPGAAPRGNFGEKAATGLARYALVPDERRWPSDGAPGLAHGCSYLAGTSRFGVCDLAGNLDEWVDGEVDGQPRAMLKGGSWLDPDAAAFRLGTRASLSFERPDLTFGTYFTGFRCARSVDR